MRCLSLLLLVMLALPVIAEPQQPCVPGHQLTPDELTMLEFPDYRKAPPNRALGDQQYRLRDVRFFRQNVFPDRTHWLARQANRFNIVTKEHALRVAFPIDQGEMLDEVKRQEAERTLRSKPYLYDALVLVRQACGLEVDLDVVVRDVWTLTPSASVSRSGGDNKTNVSLADVNILGSGKRLAFEYFDDNDRSGTFISYDDPNLLGSRWTGSLIAADNDDGERYSLRVIRPFYALDTAYSLGFTADHFIREQDLEFLGEDLHTYDADTDTANMFVAFSQGRRDGWVNRSYFGTRYIDEQFEFSNDFPGPLSTSRKFAYPYIGWELLQDSYVARTNVNRIGITEDLKLGWSSYVELGWSTDAFGGDGDYLLSQASAAYTRYFGEDHLLGLSTRFSGRYDLDRQMSQDLHWSSELSYLWEQSAKWRFLVDAHYTQTHDLPVEKQITLGGDNGLRGYPNRYQPGDRSYLITIEERYHSSINPFGMFYLGYAAFVDFGRAWFAEEPPAWVPPRRGDHFDSLVNVGIGIRLESIRTRRDRVVHIDVAKPLIDGPFVDTWEFTISAKQAF